jgi:hypothetical protein
VLGVEGLQRHRDLVQVFLVDLRVQRPCEAGTVQYQQGSAARLLNLYAERLHLLDHRGAAGYGDEIAVLDAGRLYQSWGERSEPTGGLGSSPPRCPCARVTSHGIALRN